jgi:hypothetical protein
MIVTEAFITGANDIPPDASFTLPVPPIPMHNYLGMDAYFQSWDITQQCQWSQSVPKNFVRWIISMASEPQSLNVLITCQLFVKA